MGEWRKVKDELRKCCLPVMTCKEYLEPKSLDSKYFDAPARQKEVNVYTLFLQGT